MKGKLLVLLLSLSFLLVLPGLVLAQYGTISGLVTDAQTGLPITGAHVLAMGIDCHASGWSDSNGFYTIPHLQPGAYVVRASAFGYQEQIYPDSIIVMAGQNTPDIDFALTPGSSGGTGSISGRVTDEVTNNPIIMAEIRLSGMCQSVWYT
ncbi:MAG TPA: carboxypeptidase-like regulatory domain-containing protein, partial [candidate division Zixibacteria bacterium]